MKVGFPERKMQNQEHKNVGRSPERSEAVAGNETKGLIATSTQKAVKPAETATPAQLQLLRPRPKLSPPLRPAIKPANSVATPEQA